MKQNYETLDRVASKFEEAGLLPPLAVKPKLSKRDSLIVHVFLDHIYMNVMKNLEHSIEELQKFSDDEEVKKLQSDLKDILLYESEYLLNIWSKKIEALPSVDKLDEFMKKLIEEMEKANSISLENMFKADLLEISKKTESNEG